MFGNVLMEDLKKAIQAWQPAVYSRETQYRDSLLQYLGNYFSKRSGSFMFGAKAPSIYKEYGQGRVDVLVKDSTGAKVGIELKIGKKLSSKSAVNRLTGQLRDMVREDGLEHIIVLVLGEIDPHHESMIREAISEFADPLSGRNIVLIKKSVRQSRKSSKGKTHKTKKRAKENTKSRKRASRGILDVRLPFTP